MKIVTRKQAIENGLSRFYTGKLCRHGHDSERFTSNGVCVECSAINSSNYRKEVSRLLKMARTRNRNIAYEDNIRG
ncbi:hypothetical protein [Proteus penneri]|uniref:hypothetical protein n=1 Tax=Proteus penneri TaxID=102862 RepID=UPI0007CC93AA|nr:hypothetical protein [Proteus penneri]OAH95735.1 hypothetical protein AZH52_01475 [Proteus mirabilis]